VRASGRIIGRNADCIVIPVRDVESFGVVAVECVNTEGDKQSFGPKSAGALALGNRANHTLERHVCEGWATGVHLWRALGNVVVWVAFGAGRMHPLAEWIETHQPGGPVYIAKEAPAHAV
jgi:putative DNA primase/helicase